jgi:hypothetical protein
MKQEHDRALSDKQVALLELIYKYRFGTREYIGSSLGVSSGSSLHERLEVLASREYLGKRRDIRSQALNKPIAYYVTSQGIRALLALPGHEHIGEQALRLSYQNKSTVRDDFVAHTLNLYELTLCLHRQYPELKSFTSRETIRYTYFPEKLPDRFLSLPDNFEQPHRFFLDVVRDRQSRRILESRLQKYVEFFDDGSWDETGSPLPVILIISEWQPSERGIQRFVRRVLDKLDSDLRVYTTTADAIRSASADNLAIWTDIQDADDPVSLAAISVTP